MASGKTRSIEELITSVKDRLGVEEDEARPDNPVEQLHLGSLPVWEKSADSSPRMVLGVTTWNRLPYLSRFVESFVATKSRHFDWVLVIADDGSTDGTIDYLRNLKIPGVQILKIYNKRASIAGQSNSIIRAAEAAGFDFAIKCDDDVFFNAPGWDVGYYEAASASGFDHLAFHDLDWKPGIHDRSKGALRSLTDAENAMGCLWTFTPAVVREVGYFDELAFPVRGHSHLDFTMRCCRKGFNEQAHLWFWDDENDTIGMWAREDYVDLTDWNSAEIKRVLSTDERARRMSTVLDPKRSFVAYQPNPATQPPNVELTPPNPELGVALFVRGLTEPSVGQLDLYDQAFVLNLDHHQQRWVVTATRMAKAGIWFERFPATNGYAPLNRAQWEAYASKGLTHPVERQINRKLIQSPGAWGYLSTVGRLLAESSQRRYDKVVFFDDDVLLHRDFEQQFEVVKPELGDAWKAIYLGASYEELTPLQPRSPGTVDPGDVANGSFAVALRSSAFHDLTASIDRREWPFDAGPLRDLKEDSPAGVFACRPELAIADVSVSTIRGERDQQAFAEKMGWKTEDFETGTNPPDRPTISIMVWSPGDAARLQETLRSLRLQRESNFEVLVVTQPGCTKTQSLALDLRIQDPRIRVVEVDTARSDYGFTAVLDTCRGSFVTFLWAGDIAMPDHLETLLASLASPDQLSAIPTALLLPSAASPAGRPGRQWRTTVHQLKQHLTASPSARHALLARESFETAGDLDDITDAAFTRIIRRSQRNSELTAVPSRSQPTLLIFPPGYPADLETTSHEPDPFWISPGRLLAVRTIRSAELPESPSTDHH